MQILWAILIGVAVFVLRKFLSYTKKYLIPYNIENFESGEAGRGNYYAHFHVVFQEGYLIGVKRYRLEGNLNADRPFNYDELRELLSLTERKQFHRLSKNLGTALGLHYLYEYKGREVFVNYGIPLPEGEQ